MGKKSGNFLEEHAGKIVFAVVGLISLWLLWALVLSGPYAVEYRNQKFAPGQIDSQIQQIASVLAKKLEEAPEARTYEGDEAARFIELFECSLEDVPDFSILLPVRVGSFGNDMRKYRLPDLI